MEHSSSSDLQDNRIVWFALLEHAYRVRDFRLIQRATTKLAELGVLIRFVQEGGAR